MGNMPTGNDNYIAVLLDGARIEYGYGDNQETIEQRYNNLILDAVNAITSASSELKKYDVQVELSETTKRVYIVRCNQI